LHPEICAFTSELFYESRLHSRPGLELQEIRSNGRVSGSGLRFIPVAHEGNQSSCPEEAEKIRELVAEILSSKTTWVDREGKEATIGLDDILIIAPYNAQVFELQERIPRGRIGTVDKFQGQEAPIVIYSMTRCNSPTRFAGIWKWRLPFNKPPSRPDDFQTSAERNVCQRTTGL
jgi:superfamily I DNA and/or RNA helicase